MHQTNFIQYILCRNIWYLQCYNSNILMTRLTIVWKKDEIHENKPQGTESLMAILLSNHNFWES